MIVLRAENEKLRAALHTQHALPSEEEIARVFTISIVAWNVVSTSMDIKFRRVAH